MAKRDEFLFSELEDVVAVLQSGEPQQEVVILAIPSHDRKNRLLKDQAEWADAGLRLFADLYQGATAFRAFKGVYKTDRGQYLYDEPILIESYADVTKIMDETCLKKLIVFAKRMGREANQECVMVVIGKARFYISDLKER